jgi:DNA mismatch endonuclease (patch repair protein)
MADIYTSAKRSEVMSCVRGRGNRLTELTLIALLRKASIMGWRRAQPVFGRPDFVFRQQRLAVFVDGCFWHGCPRHATKPATNRAFWRKKLARNEARDCLVNRTLRKAGWRVLRIWQHELKRDNESRCVARILRALAAADRTPTKRRAFNHP